MRRELSGGRCSICPKPAHVDQSAGPKSNTECLFESVPQIALRKACDVVTQEIVWWKLKKDGGETVTTSRVLWICGQNDVRFAASHSHSRAYINNMELTTYDASR